MDILNQQPGWVGCNNPILDQGSQQVKYLPGAHMTGHLHLIGRRICPRECYLQTLWISKYMPPPSLGTVWGTGTPLVWYFSSLPDLSCSPQAPHGHGTHLPAMWLYPPCLGPLLDGWPLVWPERSAGARSAPLPRWVWDQWLWDRGVLYQFVLLLFGLAAVP